MKIIIDIPEEHQRLCPEYYQGDIVLSQILHAVKHGTPIPDNATVCDIEQIRAEIKAEMNDIASGCVAKYSHDEGYYSGLRWALKIIDKYTK